MYSCPLMPPLPCPPACPPPRPPKDDPSSRYYREIGTSMIGNQLIIRMERSKGKSKKDLQWDPPCDCDVVEIQRPTKKEGPKILKGADNNRILFRVQSKSHMQTKENDEKTQAISYEVGQCRGGPNTNDQCRTFTIYPTLGGSAAEEVHTDRVTIGNENVFMLKVKKRSESADQPKRHIELEVRTPKPSTPPPVQPKMQQAIEKVSSNEKKQVVVEEKPKKEVTRKRKRHR